MYNYYLCNVTIIAFTVYDNALMWHDVVTRLLSFNIATPPYIPDLSGPDDTSHFEQMKSQQGSMSFGKPSRPQYGFNGQSLYFVGFTHSKFPSVTSDHPVVTMR